MFIAQVTLCSAAPGVAISQACYPTRQNHARAVLRQLLGELYLDGVLIHLGTSRCDTSLRTTPETLQHLVGTAGASKAGTGSATPSFNEDEHQYRGNGAGVMATLGTATLNLLRLVGFPSIRAGEQTVMHDVTALLALVRRQAAQNRRRDFESALTCTRARQINSPREAALGLVMVSAGQSLCCPGYCHAPM